uniref:Transmembrane protein n=1 Tax=Medicago truncatula TaxID=3880 RepID=Q2HSX8_MEDTR|nr:hypothetical protein MtrDRAFT_AC150889g37v2 [Medicago truncatula]
MLRVYDWFIRIGAVSYLASGLDRLSCTPKGCRQVASFMGLSLVTSYITIANMLGKHLDADKK